MKECEYKHTGKCSVKKNAPLPSSPYSSSRDTLKERWAETYAGKFVTETEARRFASSPYSAWT